MADIIHCNITERSEECDDRQCVCHVVYPAPHEQYSGGYQESLQRLFRMARSEFHTSSKPRDFILEMINQATGSGEHWRRTCSVSKIVVESGVGPCDWLDTFESGGGLGYAIFKIELEVKHWRVDADGTHFDSAWLRDWILVYDMTLGYMSCAMELHAGEYRPA